jgi:hypothetical protein
MRATLRRPDEIDVTWQRPAENHPALRISASTLSRLAASASKPPSKLTDPLVTRTISYQ